MFTYFDDPGMVAEVKKKSGNGALGPGVFLVILEAITCRKFNNNRAISDLNFPLVFEFWNLPLPKVLIGS